MHNPVAGQPSGPRSDDTLKDVPAGCLPPMSVRDMPEPLPLTKILGPSVILAGLGVGSGEYIIWPFITSAVGPAFLWAAVLSVTFQYFINMEIERYTLVTGETAIAGFVRRWRHWGWIFCLFTLVPNMWPGWATGGVTAFTFLIGGGNVGYITVGVMIAIGFSLTMSPVVYKTLERAQFFKVALTLVFLSVAIVAAIKPSAWADLPQAVTGFGTLPDATAIPITLLLSALVFAGAGGVNNLAQSNWIRDKGFGMGAYIPRIVSPITGEDVALPTTGVMMRTDAANLARFAVWWKRANTEQLVSFWFICIFSIVTFSLLAHSTISGQQFSAQANLGFIKAEGEMLQTRRRAVVRQVLLGLRIDVAGAGRARHGRLHRPHRRRHPAHRVPAGQRVLEREPHLLLRGVGGRGLGVGDPAERRPAAAGAADDGGLPQRAGDGGVRRAAGPVEPARTAEAAPHPRHATGDAGARDLRSTRSSAAGW